MPHECELLYSEPYHLNTCPLCCASFKPFLRGQIQRRKYSFLGLLTGKIRPYCALICSNCKEIVGHEDPINRIWEEFYEC